MHDASPGRDPFEQVTDLVLRTLRVLYAGFGLALIVYALVLLVIVPLAGRAPWEGRTLPRNWSQWQFFLAVAGVVCLYVSQRLQGLLIAPARVGPRPGEITGDTPEARARAAQGIMGRMVSGHVILWCLAEVPALLGAVERIVSGQTRFFAALLVLSAIGLILHRPSRERVAATLAPLRGAAPAETE